MLLVFRIPYFKGVHYPLPELVLMLELIGLVDFPFRDLCGFLEFFGLLWYLRRFWGAGTLSGVVGTEILSY